ncbi:hypothetical protein [Nonomuraea rubra]|uniref:Uncharacterized protein n=1 Tax=Nonomuraea rubra TaxID=46180 RepID=A0A7X0NX77_9ACTN|nr:hypothetical protein [Nonomuraea rubra]MBB6551260.1 hypothetical protein [Nonomuraea rubra]
MIPACLLPLPILGKTSRIHPQPLGQLATATGGTELISSGTNPNQGKAAS